MWMLRSIQKHLWENLASHLGEWLDVSNFTFLSFFIEVSHKMWRVNRYAYHKIDFTTIKLQIPDLQVMSLKTTWDFTILAFSKNEFYGQHEQVLYIMKIQSFDQGDSASNSCRQSRVEIYMAQKRLGVEKKI